MILNRRNAMGLFAGAASGFALRRGSGQTPLSPVGPGQSPLTPPLKISPGQFTNTRQSIAAYTLPEWFGKAKFGIWAHWGPQSAIGDGDWYARKMYIEGDPVYDYHRKRFGPQSKVGYKDLLSLYTADKFDPDHLIGLYKKAGARYFVSMGVHHDNYDLWNSKYQPRWNSVSTGPRKDIVGLWAAAARKQGLRFGVSEHLAPSYHWFQPAHGADTKGAYAGVPYDGQNPLYDDLYHNYTDNKDQATKWSPGGPEWWKLQYFNRIKDLLDQHRPDFIYTDGGIVYEEYGLGLVAETYNVGAHDADGRAQAVFASKYFDDSLNGHSCLLDNERGIIPTIWPVPWQTDTCIGGWHYQVGRKYKTARKVINLLVDIVSKNGNLLLNLPLPASGELDPEESKILAEITDWTSVNMEGIHDSRPWKVHGEGPAFVKTKAIVGMSKNESQQPDLTALDLRFTTKGDALYVFIMGWPEKDVQIESLALGGPQDPAKVANVRMLGIEEKLKFSHDATGLRVTMPNSKPSASDIGVTLLVRFA